MSREGAGRRKAIFLLLAAMILLASATLASAKAYRMTLLTVGEAGDQVVGGTAEAYLEIKPGSGRIFLDSFPLTKIDTQISTRYASQIACDYLDYDCSRTDFFYTIRADSSIVGGPSASAPLTIMTIAALTGAELKNETVMTGTINSGGGIGPVGGVLKKAEAAQKAGFARILVPKFSILDEEDEGGNKSASQANSTNPRITGIKVTRTNNSGDTVESNLSVSYNISGGAVSPNKSGQPGNLTIEIVRVSTLEEALPYFIENPPIKEAGDIEIPAGYTNAMREVATSLCGKAADLKSRLRLNATEANLTADFESKVNRSLSEENYYSAASFCFSMGVYLRKINLRQVEKSNPEQLELVRRKALEAVLSMDMNLEDRNITTLPELETYIILKERIIESKNLLIEMRRNISSDQLAYAIERYYSAVFWSSFFSLDGRAVELDQEYLQDACRKKISEAEERFNYADFYLPSLLEPSRKDLEEAYAYSGQRNYKMCLFKASFAKSEANLVLSGLVVRDDKIAELTADKLASAKKLIARENGKGFFPILGYSYYEYSKSLSDNGDEVSSLIFSEYSLELSNIEIYFPKKGFRLPAINSDLLLLAASSALFGVALGSLLTLKALRGSRKPPRDANTSARKKKKGRRQNSNS